TGQQADVKVILNPGTANQIVSPAVGVSAGPLAPALFTFNGQGTGNAAALDATKGYAYLANTSVVASGVSAAPGDVISLYGTGFGPTNPAYLPGVFADPHLPLPFLTTSPVTVTIGNVTVSGGDISYAGLAFDAPGLYQVNVKVPNVPDGDQPVSVHVGNAVTQGGVTIPVKK
ncbi:MAG: peptidase fungalysin, partial [Bryobacterales bacterium]|nr:peptidase fungalysin [Bryobacterales bacterium]